ncbi:MAG: hypothetical protein ACI4VM_01960 [Anaerovoracaceae bacterium]
MYRFLLFRRAAAGLLSVLLLASACGCGKDQGEGGSGMSSAGVSAEENTGKNDEDSSILDFFKGGSSGREGSDKETSKRVGEEKYGFLEVPDDWKDYVDSEVAAVSGLSLKQFCDASGKLIITLNYSEGSQVDAQEAASSCWAQMEQDGAQNIQGSTVELAGCKAYQVYGYYTDDDVMLVIWVFTDKDGTLHYISAEGPLDSVMDCVKLVEETFALK